MNSSMHCHGKLWVSKFTYSARVGSNDPHALLTVLFLWSSIVLLIGLQWKKDSGGKAQKMSMSMYSVVAECSQDLE